MNIQLNQPVGAVDINAALASAEPGTSVQLPQGDVVLQEAITIPPHISLMGAPTYDYPTTRLITAMPLGLQPTKSRPLVLASPCNTSLEHVVLVGYSETTIFDDMEVRGLTDPFRDAAEGYGAIRLSGSDPRSFRLHNVHCEKYFRQVLENVQGCLVKANNVTLQSVISCVSGGGHWVGVRLGRASNDTPFLADDHRCHVFYADARSFLRLEESCLISTKWNQSFAILHKSTANAPVDFPHLQPGIFNTVVQNMKVRTSFEPGSVFDGLTMLGNGEFEILSSGLMRRSMIQEIRSKSSPGDSNATYFDIVGGTRVEKSSMLESGDPCQWYIEDVIFGTKFGGVNPTNQVYLNRVEIGGDEAQQEFNFANRTAGNYTIGAGGLHLNSGLKSWAEGTY